MTALYAPEATFSDPVFPALHGSDIGAMWSMLLGRAKEFDVQLDHLAVTESSARAQWTATYLFGRRPVTNRVTSDFHTESGRIRTQKDAFSFWKWSRQALGPLGWIAGWTAFLRARVRKDAARRLATHNE